MGKNKKEKYYNIIKNLGFTSTEANVILFLLLVFTLGLGIKYYDNILIESKIYDYSKSDSLFKSRVKKGNSEITEKKVDNNYKLLDFSNDKIDSKVNNSVNSETLRIDLNKADLSLLVKLPGVGVKTAEKILRYRSKNGSFKRVEELIKVKGIGNKKLEKIKKLVYVE